VALNVWVVVPLSSATSKLLQIKHQIRTTSSPSLFSNETINSLCKLNRLTRRSQLAHVPNRERNLGPNFDKEINRCAAEFLDRNLLEAPANTLPRHNWDLC
jgi:hypothetical protein